MTVDTPRSWKTDGFRSFLFGFVFAMDDRNLREASLKVGQTVDLEIPGDEYRGLGRLGR